jgi:transcriptional regulator with XRE-family HTH domain/mannose-6-phosphate isomerase-like protein (cupin superfamily)
MLGIGEKLRAARLGQNLSLRELAARAEVSASLLSQIENDKANPSVRSLHSIADALSLPVDYFFPSIGSASRGLDGIGTASRGLDGIGTASRGLEGEDGNEGETESAPGVGGNMTASELRAIQASAPAGSLVPGFEDQEQSSESPVMRCSARPTIELEGGVTWARLTPGPEEGVEFLQICYEVGASSGRKMSHHVGREFGLVLEGELLLELGFERYLLKAGDSIIFDSKTPHRLTNAGQVAVRAIWVVMSRY